jgi:uncharacterized repeat protein (TIGR03803 family)
MLGDLLDSIIQNDTGRLQERYAMRISGVGRYALTSCVVVAMLADCGGSQPPISASSATMQTSAARSLQMLPRIAKGFKGIFDFNGTDGAKPAGLVALDGKLYGLTSSGGAYNAGTAFTITPSGSERVLHSFGSGSDGHQPEGSLLALDGTLYGTTTGGGADSFGTAFALNTSGKELWLYSFSGEPGGAMPFGGFVGVNGALFGTTSEGGNGCVGNGYGCGIIFSMTTSGKEKTLYLFPEDRSDGGNPNAPLTNVTGTLYGTTQVGGKYTWGTLYKASTAGKVTLLHSFGAGTADGTNPGGTLTLFKGNLYGTTSSGGGYDDGTVFETSLTGKELVIHSFTDADGTDPSTGLTLVKHTFYSTASSGGARAGGTIYSVTPGGKLKVLHDFYYGSGSTPQSTLVLLNGTLYGTTSSGGKHRMGTVFAFTP